MEELSIEEMTALRGGQNVNVASFVAAANAAFSIPMNTETNANNANGIASSAGQGSIRQNAINLAGNQVAVQS